MAAPSVARALAANDASLLPGRRDEDWRWTDLRGLIREAPPPSQLYDGPLAPGPFDAVADEVCTVVNGARAVQARLSPGQTETLALRFVSAGAVGGHAARATVEVGQGAKLTLLESYEGQAAGYLADAALEISVAAGGSLERIVLADDAEDAVSVSTATVTLAPGARYAQTTLTHGARRQRLETRLHHPGGGAEVRIDGAYLLAERRHADLTSHVAHTAVDGNTDQLVKGVARDQARGVFQGRITVEPGADRTDARMGHHALLLSDRAEVDAKPELLIFADDVSCAHGNTVGALDEQALFYAAQRGIGPDEARALLIAAFVGEVVDRIEHDGAREAARAWVEARLR